MSKVIFDVSDLNALAYIDKYLDDHMLSNFKQTWPDELIINQTVGETLAELRRTHYHLKEAPIEILFRGIPCRVQAT